MGLFGNLFSSTNQIKNEHISEINRKYNNLIRKAAEELPRKAKNCEILCYDFSVASLGISLSSVERLIKQAESDAQIWGGEFTLASDLDLVYQKYKNQYIGFQKINEQRRKEEDRKKAEDNRRELEERQRREAERLAREKELIAVKQKKEAERREKEQMMQTMLAVQKQILGECREILLKVGYTDIDFKISQISDYDNSGGLGYRAGSVSAKKTNEDYVVGFSSAIQLPYTVGLNLLRTLATIAANVDISCLESRNLAIKEMLKVEGLMLHSEHREFEIVNDFLVFRIVYSGQEILLKFYTSSTQKVQMNFDSMDGHKFEYFCAEILKKNGYEKINVTQGSGDQGIDIIAYRDGIKYGIQCKCYSSDIGNKAVQEVFAGKTFYECHIGVVLTNQYFTKSAIDLAKKNGVILWDRKKLLELIESANRNN